MVGRPIAIACARFCTHNTSHLGANSSLDAIDKALNSLNSGGRCRCDDETTAGRGPPRSCADVDARAGVAQASWSERGGAIARVDRAQRERRSGEHSTAKSLLRSISFVGTPGFPAAFLRVTWSLQSIVTAIQHSLLSDNVRHRRGRSTVPGYSSGSSGGRHHSRSSITHSLEPC
eukprot:scaffold25920_cov64-Phaeocystis_antarctica.AAC.3